MGENRDGVEIRERSIRIHFTYHGEARKETLKTDGEPMAPTPANVKYARRLAAEIRDRIRHGTFSYAEYFPASKNATTGQGAMLGDRLDLWLGLQVGKESSTLKGYRVAVEWWKAKLGRRPVRSIVHSDVLQALAEESKWSGKTRNNKVSVLRMALRLCLRDGILTVDPLAGLEAFAHQHPDPDPFSLEEAESIIAGLAKHCNEQIARYFGVKFFTGLRTSESLAMQWNWIDWPQETMGVGQAIVLGEYKANTKTNTVRQVQLNTRALAYLREQKPASFMLRDGWVFPDPRTGERFTDDEPPRELWWRPCLKRLGIRYRSPYETRHTYATIMLMQGVTPAYAARQMGHSIEMFLRTYSKWIDGGQNAVEMAKIEAGISPKLPRLAEN